MTFLACPYCSVKLCWLCPKTFGVWPINRRFKFIFCQLPFYWHWNGMGTPDPGSRIPDPGAPALPQDTHLCRNQRWQQQEREGQLNTVFTGRTQVSSVTFSLFFSTSFLFCLSLGLEICKKRAKKGEKT